MNPLPILLYHTVDDDPPAWIAPFAVARRAFAQQLDMIVDSGRTVVTAGQIVAARRGGPPVRDDAVAITFDDGFRDFADFVQPQLAARGLPAALFVTTGALAPLNRSLLPTAAMLSSRQVADLAVAGVEIGAHSHWHSPLDVLEGPEAEQELARSRDVLQQLLGRAVDLFAYPYGMSSAAVRRLTAAHGYRGAFAVREAFSPPDDDPFRIARLTVRADTSRRLFAAWLHGAAAPVATRGESLRSVAFRVYRRQSRRWRAVTTL